MKKIVSILRPFTLNQNLFVYEDGNKLEVVSAPMETVHDYIVDLAQKHDVKEVQLIGAKTFANGIKVKVERAEMIRYNVNNIKVKVMSN